MTYLTHMYPNKAFSDNQSPTYTIFGSKSIKLKSYKYFNLANKMSLKCNFFIDNWCFRRKKVIYTVSVQKRRKKFQNYFFGQRLKICFATNPCVFWKKLFLGYFSIIDKFMSLMSFLRLENVELGHLTLIEG